MKRLVKSILRRSGFDFVRYSPKRDLEPAPQSDLTFADLSEQQKQTIVTATPFTITSVERMAALISAGTDVTHKAITGDIADRVLWRAGSRIADAFTYVARDEGR